MLPSGGRARLTFTLICCYIPFLCPLLFARAHIQRPSAKHNAIIGKRDALSDSGLSTASWIWTAEPTVGNVAFLRTFSSAAGKTAASATISVTAVNQATVWVNGQPIGATGKGADDWKTAQVFSAGLNASTNTFSILAVNDNNSGAPAPGLLAAIKIKYADGSGEAVVSDGGWTVSAVIPSDFPIASDTSHFVPATVAAAFGSGPWGSSVTASSSPSNSAILSESTWIWSTAAALTKAATGPVGFRKTVPTPGGKIAQSATILMTADNGFQLYVNGEYIGQSPGVPTIPDFGTAQQFTVNLDSASNVFSVIATNIAAAGSTDAGPAGLAGSITFQYSDGTTSVTATDATWLTGPFKSVAQFLAATDATLTKTFALAKMGAQPWGALKGISNALAAPQVPAGPFASGTVPATPPSGNSASAGASAPASQPSSASPASASGSSVSSADHNSTPGVGGGLASSPSETGTAPESTSAGASNTNTDTDANAGASTSHSMSTSVIIAIIVAVLALIGIAVLFFWRRRRTNNISRHSMSRDLFDAANGVGRSGGASASQRSSIGSAAHAEMVMVQPQQPSYTYNHPRPPVLVQGVYMQAPPPGQSYPQPPLPAVLGHPGNANRLVVVGEPPLSPISPMRGGQQMAAQQQQHMAAQQMFVQQRIPPPQMQMAAQQQQHMAAQQMFNAQQQSQIPPPQMQMSAPPVAAQQMPTQQQPGAAPVPLSKLEREALYWQNNANTASATSSARTSMVTDVSSSTVGSSRHSKDQSVDPYGGYDADTLAPPPSYSVQSPLHMQ
ncbi:hypothetical protein B0H14DRAFT_3144749 [Mycena olivaceomarginata]|nr:hypothetical protein B0H14DRAFT_3144749 [Mycena olivaceomarginata]